MSRDEVPKEEVLELDVESQRMAALRAQAAPVTSQTCCYEMPLEKKLP